MNDQELVITAVRAIFLKSGYDPNGPLAQRDLEFICKKIEEYTSILISVSTLKRLRNGDFGRIPQVATLNALSTYLGFKNWQDFKTAQSEVKVPTAPVLANAKQQAGVRAWHTSWKLRVAVSVVLLAIIITSFLSYRSKPNSQNGTLYFTARKTTGNAIPNTVVFSYGFGNVEADSFFIQQSWDKRRRVRIDKNTHILTDIYYEPGYHVAKLMADNTILKTVDVSIPTDAWMVYTSSFTGNKLPQYIDTGKTFAEISQSLNDSVLQKKHISTDGNTTFVSSYFPSTLIGDGDNFTCSMRARLVDSRAKQCPFLMFEVFCQRTFMYFMSMNKGCASQANAQFGELALSGKTADLSPLCFGLQQWNDISWQVKDKKVIISINGQKVFETSYNQSCGKIAGIGVISNGFYELSSINLKGLDGKGISESGFGE